MAFHSQARNCPFWIKQGMLTCTAKMQIATHSQGKPETRKRWKFCVLFKIVNFRTWNREPAGKASLMNCLCAHSCERESRQEPLGKWIHLKTAWEVYVQVPTISKQKAHLSKVSFVNSLTLYPAFQCHLCSKIQNMGPKHTYPQKNYPNSR